MKFFRYLFLWCFLSSLSFNLSAVISYLDWFIGLSPSSTIAGMGRDTAVSDIWHQSAFSAISNPALSCFQKGVTLSFQNNNWFDAAWFDLPKSLNANYLNIGYKGIGMNFPLPNSTGRWGTTYDYNQADWDSPFDWQTAANYNLSLKAV